MYSNPVPHKSSQVTSNGVVSQNQFGVLDSAEETSDKATATSEGLNILSDAQVEPTTANATVRRGTDWYWLNKSSVKSTPSVEQPWSAWAYLKSWVPTWSSK